MKGKFIVFDGLPGSGKGTMIKKTFEYLFDKSKEYDSILITDEPTRGPHGKKVRELFKQQKTPEDLKEEIFQAFVDDRKWHIKEIIRPALEKDMIVICDRYKYSSIVYQTIQGNKFGKVFAAHKEFLSPDLAIILDLPPEVGVERMNKDKSKKRSETDNFRELEFISKLRGGYLALKEQLPNENIQIIDASKPILDVFNSIQKEIAKVLQIEK